MFSPFVTLIGLWLPTSCLLSLAAGPVDDGTVETCTIVLGCVDVDDAEMRVGVPARSCCVATCKSGGPSLVCCKVSCKGDETAGPKVWIGVRVTAVPAPLAAHVGEGGVMISNVVKDGPADKAGLEQYDVVVSFDGQDIDGPKNLTDAIAKTGADQVAKLVVVRKGQPHKLEIKPTQRPTDRECELKYEEPEEASVDAALKLRGKALRLGPHGRWIMKDLGALRCLPDALKELEEFDIDIDLDELVDPDLFDQDLELKVLKHLDDAFTWQWRWGDDEDAEVEVRIRVEEDGKGTSIEIDADGKIHVIHEAAEGNETSATYDSPEELEEADPAAYELYGRHSIHHGPALIHVRPFGKEALKLQHDFQIDVQKKLQDAFERARKTREQAGPKHQKALEDAQRALRKARVQIRKQPGIGPAVDADTLLVLVDDSGKIKVTLGQDGDKVTYEFKSKEEFKAAEPELYERVESLLE